MQLHSTPNTSPLKGITLTPAQLTLYKEKAIREFRLRQEAGSKMYRYARIVENLKRIAPLNYSVGLVAAATLVAFKGWEALAYLLLSAIVGLTLVPAFTAFLLKKT